METIGNNHTRRPYRNDLPARFINYNNSQFKLSAPNLQELIITS